MSDGSEFAPSPFETSRRRGRGQASTRNEAHRRRLYSADDGRIDLLVGPFDDVMPVAERSRRAMPANVIEILRKGDKDRKLDTLENDLKKGLDRHQGFLDRRDYLAYRSRAMSWRGKYRILPACECDDPRFFESRACAVNPQGPFAEWFFGLDDDPRRLLVGVSRRAGVIFLKPGQIDPGIAHIEWLKRFIADICP